MAAASLLVAYVNQLLGQSLDLSADIKKGALAPVAAAVGPQAAALLALEAEADVEAALALLVDVQLATPEPEPQLRALLAAATSDAGDKPVLRLRVATNVFNKAAGFPALRFDALVAVIEFASASGNAALVSGYYDSAETLLGDKLTPAQRRKLFLAIADAAAKDDAASTKVLAFLEKYLATFAGVTDAKELEAGKDVAARAAKLVLKQPVASFLARVDLLAHPVVAATLKPCKTNGKLFELLEIVSTKTLAEFAAFSKANAAVLKDNDLDETELSTAMRLFTLASLPTGFDEIPYAAVAKKLDVAEDAVEQWVVRAITAGVVTAKIDQLRRTVVISRALQRGFGAAQWAEVDAKLQQYKTNVGSLLQIIRNARQAQAAQ